MKINKDTTISLDSFTFSTRAAFPESECTEQYEDDPNLFYSSYWYEVIIANLKFPTDSYFIDYCKPYVWRKDNKSGFGWDKRDLSTFTGDFWPNIVNPVRNENMVVIAFRKVSFEEIENSMIFKKKVAEYGVKCQVWDD